MIHNRLMSVRWGREAAKEGRLGEKEEGDTERRREEEGREGRMDG